MVISPDEEVTVLLLHSVVAIHRVSVPSTAAIAFCCTVLTGSDVSELVDGVWARIWITILHAKIYGNAKVYGMAWRKMLGPAGITICFGICMIFVHILDK